MKAFLGIDWGGTFLKAGLVNSKGNILKKKVYSSDKLQKKEFFIRNIQNLLDYFSKFNIKAIGIGAPGIINVNKGFIYYLPNIKGWENYPLRTILEERLGLSVRIDNDANVFGLAEARCGAAKGKQRVIFLTLGTGLGGAVISGGKLLRGQTSSAELGHVPINLEGRSCGCGSRGCIETYTGNNYLLKRYRQLTKEREKIKDTCELFIKGLNGEKEALLVWKEFSFCLGKFLAGMVNIFNPEVIVCGGGVSGAFRLFKPMVEQTIRKNAMWPQVKNVKLVKAKLKQAGIIGAALLAKEMIR